MWNKKKYKNMRVVHARMLELQNVLKNILGVLAL